MILSDRDILSSIKTKDIVISPFNKQFLKPASFSFTLGKTLFKPVPNQEVGAVDPKLDYEQIEIEEEGFVLNPGDFVLAQTAETLTISTKLAAKADTPTTLARIGLQVVSSSTFIEPGQEKSHETLEIKNLSSNPIRVKAGMKIVKVIFFKLNSPSIVSYAQVGDYAKQDDPRPI